VVVSLEWKHSKKVQKETEGQVKFGNSSFTVKKSENLASVRAHTKCKGHASDSCLTEET
jgi:hypothetical protein